MLSDPGSPVSLLIWIYAVGMLAFMGMNGVLALYLGKAYGVTKETIGYFYSYIGAIGIVMRALLLGPTVRRFGEVGVTRMGSLSLVLGLALIPVPAMFDLTRPERFAALALIVLFVPVGTALLFPATTALVSRRATRSEMGQTMGVQQAFGSTARVVGPICAGWLYEINIRLPVLGRGGGDARHQLPHLAADRGGAGEAGGGRRGAGDRPGVELSVRNRKGPRRVAAALERSQSWS